MLVIDQTLMGRKFYTNDIKQKFICRGMIISGTILLLGEYPDSTYKCNRLSTHKLSEVKFDDFVPPPPTVP